MGAEVVIILVVLVLSLSVHEYAHAKIADTAGDPTPRIYGRVTLNPIAHLDPVGSLFMLFSAMSGFGIGWAKPVPVDPRKMRNPRWDHFSTVIGGPLSNLLLAVMGTIVLKVLMLSGMRFQLSDLAAYTILIFIIVNLSLFTFNLIPLGPLDGMWILGTFLPERIRIQWIRWNLTMGQFVFLAAVLLPIFDGGSLISKVLIPVQSRLLTFLLGI